MWVEAPQVDRCSPRSYAREGLSSGRTRGRGGQRILTASEFAFLAFGLVLGLASGAALIEVLRARPPAPREVRLTVSPNAIQSRLSSTLSDPMTIDHLAGPARGGPGDRRWHDEPEEPAIGTSGRRSEDPVQDSSASPSPAVAGLGNGTSVRSGIAVAEPPAASPPATSPPSFMTRPTEPDRLDEVEKAGSPRPARRRLPPMASGASMTLMPVRMSMEPDPLTMALRSGAAAAAIAAGSRSSAGTSAGHVHVEPNPGAPTASSGPERKGTAAGSSAPTGEESVTGTTSETGPCADERRVAEERCAVATRARAGADAAADTFRLAQRTYDDHVSQADTAATAADPRSVRSAKEAAQQRFRDARAGAANRDDVENAARAWLAEINDINNGSRGSAQIAERHRALAAAIAVSLERLAVEADAARISAEQADEACLAAREAVAACDEALAREAAVARVTGPPRETAATVARRGGGIARFKAEPEEDFGSAPMGSRAGEDALIIRILRGDRDAMQRAVALLAGDNPDERRRWQSELSELVEALIARSIEASSFDFPLDHPFWGPFSQAQNRDIAAALSSLGFRFDGFGGWVDERFPGQRDLAMAVGYAGLDPMRIRHWPNEPETSDLLRGVRVAADEYVMGSAGGLSLGELVTLLGRRADALTDL